MSNDTTEIIFIVDRSGSMSTIAPDMRGGFDAFIAEQRKVPGECLVTLAQFDDRYEVVYSGKPLAEVPPLELEPRSMTALLDGIGRTIDDVGMRLDRMPKEKRPSKVLVVIITDGQENSSRKYKHADVMEKIKHQRERYSWEFVFLGANQDAIQVGADLGVANAMNYTADSASAGAMMSAVSANAAQYRTGGKVTSSSLQHAYDQAKAGRKPDGTP